MHEYENWAEKSKIVLMKNIIDSIYLLRQGQFRRHNQRIICPVRSEYLEGIERNGDKGFNTFF